MSPLTTGSDWDKTINGKCLVRVRENDDKVRGGFTSSLQIKEKGTPPCTAGQNATTKSRPICLVSFTGV